MDKPPIKVHDCSALELRIHVLGYFPKGESILIILWNNHNKTVCQSILVDCFEMSNKNNFEPLFNEYKLKKNKLNYFIWTHPDEDHSVGIPKIVNNYIDKNTLIFIPYGLSWDTMSIRNINKRRALKEMVTYSNVFQSFLSVLKCSRKRSSIVEPVSSSRHQLRAELYGDIIKDNFNTECSFKIEILTPFRDMSFTKSVTNSSILKNDLSISFNLVFGQYRFFFGGDAENEALKNVREKRLNDTIFVKIPHHSSNSSDMLPTVYKRILQNAKVSKPPLISAITTSYENNSNIQLPNITVLDEYKKCTRGIYLTKSNTIQVNNYGIWTFCYKYQSVLPIAKNNKGDASVYYELTVKKGRKKK